MYVLFPYLLSHPHRFSSLISILPFPSGDSLTVTRFRTYYSSFVGILLHFFLVRFVSFVLYVSETPSFLELHKFLVCRSFDHSELKSFVPLFLSPPLQISSTVPSLVLPGISSTIPQPSNTRLVYPLGYLPEPNGYTNLVFISSLYKMKYEVITRLTTYFLTENTPVTISVLLVDPSQSDQVHSLLPLYLIPPSSPLALFISVHLKENLHVTFLKPRI